MFNFMLRKLCYYNIYCFFRYEFFNDLYHRFLSTPKVEMKCMCLQAMTIVYGRYYEDIGPFADTKYIVQMLDRVRMYIYIICYTASKSFCSK